MMFKHYAIRLVLRFVAVAALGFLYLTSPHLLLLPLDFQLFSPPSPLHLIWAVLMAGMLWHLLPYSRLSLAGRKQFAQNYLPKEYRKEDLTAFVKEANRRAARVMLLWLFAHAMIFLLYAKNIIGAAELIMLSALYFLGDLVCIVLFCPFQRWLMKSRCCVGCRIFDWGHMMMFTPLAPLGGFFSRSLCITAGLLFLMWEIRFARHPERFWISSNAALICASCKDKLCRIKNRYLFKKR